MFDEEERPQSTAGIPRNLETLSVGELKEYIVQLQREIKRAEENITQKQAASNAADAFFK